MDIVSVIKLGSLKPWYSPASNDVKEKVEETNNDNERQFKFEICPFLNKKIYLCQGGISQLELDCVVLPVNEMKLTNSPLSKEVYHAAGCLLPAYYENIRDVKTGNVVLGSGFDLPSRYIIHAMEPGMNAKFKSAVENAVHTKITSSSGGSGSDEVGSDLQTATSTSLTTSTANQTDLCYAIGLEGCYRNAMELAHENNLKTIGFVSLYENVTHTLSEEMAHTAIGTVRCYLEKHRDNFEAVVFSVKNSDLDLYLKLFPAYFPRSIEEAAEVSHLLAMRDLGEWGEKVNADRAIRICHIPLSKTLPLCNSADNLPPTTEVDGADAVVGKRSFSFMDGDHDVMRLRKIKSMNEESIQVTRQRIYRRLLCLAHSDNLDEISSTNSFYLSGCDKDGDPVAVVVANRITIDEKNADKALLYFIRTLDSVANNLYSLVYFHTMSQAQNHPSLSFIKRVYNVLDNRYKANLKRLYMVHPSFTSRVFTWFFTTFSAADVKRQILTVKNIPQLYNYIAPDQIEIPPFVSDYDLKINHEVYKVKVLPTDDISPENENCEL